MIYVLKQFEDYDTKRYGTPWGAICGANGLPDFKAKPEVHFSGGHGKAGDLFVADPEEYSLFLWGQKDYKGNCSQKNYAQFQNGEFVPVPSEKVAEALTLWEQHKCPISPSRQREMLTLLLQLFISQPDSKKHLHDLGITQVELDSLHIKFNLED